MVKVTGSWIAAIPSALGAEGRGFDSPLPEKITTNEINPTQHPKFWCWALYTVYVFLEELSVYLAFSRREKV